MRTGTIEQIEGKQLVVAEIAPFGQFEQAFEDATCGDFIEQTAGPARACCTSARTLAALVRASSRVRGANWRSSGTKSSKRFRSAGGICRIAAAICSTLTGNETTDWLMSASCAGNLRILYYSLALAGRSGQF